MTKVICRLVFLKILQGILIFNFLFIFASKQAGMLTSLFIKQGGCRNASSYFSNIFPCTCLIIKGISFLSVMICLPIADG